MPGGVLGQIVDCEANIAVQVTHFRSPDDHAGGEQSRGTLDHLHLRQRGVARDRRLHRFSYRVFPGKATALEY